jgi:TonB family protein
MAASTTLAVAALGQTAAVTLPDLPKEPAAIFAAAAPLYDFKALALKPWHIHVSYQLYDLDSQPTVQGSFDYWWAGAKRWRTTWKREGMEESDWWLDGKHYRTSSGGSRSYFERNILSALEPELAKVAAEDPAKHRLELEREQFGKEKLPCVRVIAKEPGKPEVQHEPWFYPTYCFDPKHPFVTTYSPGMGETVTYGRLVQFQQFLVAKSLTVYSGMRKGLTVTMETLEVTKGDDEALAAPAGVTAEGGAVDASKIPDVIVGSLVKKTQPIYPQADKSARRQGMVFLVATIGKDGSIQDVEVLSGPSKTMEDAALAAVSQWTYKPYLLDGQPTEVETTVNVTFSLGR